MTGFQSILFSWIKRRRKYWAKRGRDRLIYDGDCCFCQKAFARIQALDPTGRVEGVNFRGRDVKEIDSRLTQEACQAKSHLIEREGKLSAGFDAFRRLSLRLPLMWPAALLMNLPGMRYIGEPIYNLIARIRFKLSSWL